MPGRYNPELGYKGPFKGLATSIPPAQLPPPYAARAENVLFTDGRIVPHPPWEPVSRVTQPGIYKPAYIGVLPTRTPISIFAFTPPSQLGLPRIHLVQHDTGIYAYYEGDDLPPVWLCATQSAQACFVPDLLGRWVYILDGGQRMYKTNGTPQGTFLMGITPPPIAAFQFTSLISFGTTAASFDYAFTISNADGTVESNPTLSTGHTRDVDTSIKIVFITAQLPVVQEDRTKLRIYRKNLGESQIGYRLIGERTFSPTGPNEEFIDDLEEDDITLSGAADGPFAPSKNFVPRYATVGTIYQNRLVLNRTDTNTPNRFFFSEAGQPEHVDYADYRDIPGKSATPISGLTEYDGALLLGKQDGIWSLAGTVITLTNAEIALGATPQASFDVLTGTRAAFGPNNKTGNGFVKAGTPARIYFGNDTGFYRWDGLEPSLRSGMIRPTWKRLMRDDSRKPFAELSYGQDHERGLIYIANGLNIDSTPLGDTDEERHAYRRGQDALVYDYVNNAWSTVHGDDYAPIDDSAPSGVDTYLIPLCFGTTDDGRCVMATPTGAVFITGRAPEHQWVEDKEYTHKVDRVPLFAYESGDVAPVQGLRFHLHAVRWLTAAPNPVVDTIPKLDVAALVDDYEAERFLLVGAEPQHAALYHAVRAEGHRIRLRIERSAEWLRGYDDYFSVTGWHLDGELVGQRY